VIRIGWHETFDRDRAARFIENMRTFDTTTAPIRGFRKSSPGYVITAKASTGCSVAISSA
jgi:hypothetical protein